MSRLFSLLSRLHRLLKKSSRKRFVTGHDFSRADKPFISLLESASQFAEKLLIALGSGSAGLQASVKVLYL
jgi:hypothetical protein